MKRKVVQIAGFTKVVSLPAQWVKANNVQKGDELEVKTEGDYVLIQSPSSSSKKKGTLDLTKSDKFLKRFVDVYYRLGYDEVDVYVPEEYMISLIQQEVSQRLLGFEIVEQKNKFCKIKSISSGNENEFDIILRRIFLMLISMSRDGLDLIKAGKIDKLDSLISLEDINNKFTNFCQRTLNKYGHDDSNKTIVTYYVISFMEMLADSFAQIFRNVDKLGTKKVDKKILELYTLVSGLLSDFYGMFYDFKIEKLLEFDKKRKTILKKTDYWFSGCKTPEENHIVALLFAMSTKLHHLTEAVHSKDNPKSF